MRNRNIKSVAHWVIMSFILLFPIVLVGLSSFADSHQETIINYKYETNDVNSFNDLKEGNIYHFSHVVHDDITISLDMVAIYNLHTTNKDGNTFNYGISYSIMDNFYNDSVYYRILYKNDFQLNVYDSNDNTYIASIIPYLSASQFDNIYSIEFDFVYKTGYTSVSQFSSKCENILIDSVSIDNKTMKQDIVNWIDDFVNLPVNSWYLSLMNILSIPFVSSGVMSVIYIYPLYVVWVYVFDFIVDIFLFFVKLGHDLLQKLGGKNE